jgi:hypothetical protein
VSAPALAVAPPALPARSEPPKPDLKLTGLSADQIRVVLSPREIEKLSKLREDQAALENARGVCLLRAGDTEGALQVFGDLVLLSGSGRLSSRVPIAYRINYAAALLRANRVAECLDRLEEIDANQDAAVQRLRSVIANWEAGLTWWEKMKWSFGTSPSRPVSFDFPLGEL